MELGVGGGYGGVNRVQNTGCGVGCGVGQSGAIRAILTLYAEGWLSGLIGLALENG